MSAATRHASSFRDPSGFVFRRDGILYRQVNRSYAPELERLFGSGLHQSLVADGLLVDAERLDIAALDDPEAVALLRPVTVPMISYPYEWCFGQLKDAALLTLDIAERALNHGMVLKDATAYNVQFLNGRPVFIDTLSFETYVEGEAWIAYRQFCQHFLAPLALAALVDARLLTMLRVHLDGIPLDLAAHMLPAKARLKPALLTHLFLHAKALSADAQEGPARTPPKISKIAMLGLLSSLRGAVQGLAWNPEGTEWADYYDQTNYTMDAMAEKRRVVVELLRSISPRPLTAWDLGANTGEFSRLAASEGIATVAWDVDIAAVEKAYRYVRKEKTGNLLPLVQDLTNPSPSLGWAASERDSLAARGPADVILALALIHHLAIGNNVPLPWIARNWADLAAWAIVEFVPKEDSQVQRLLRARKDVFPTYDQAGFEGAFGERFEIRRRQKIAGTERTLYLLRRREP